MPIFGRRQRGGCGGGCTSMAETPSYHPSNIHGGASGGHGESSVLAESAMQEGYDTAKTRVALRDGSSGDLAITSAPATGEAAAFRRATAARLSAGAGTPSLDLASRDELVVAGTELHQRVENVVVRCGRRRVVYQPQVVTEVVETHRLQSQSVLINDIPDPMGRMHLSLGSNDRAFIDLASIGKNCLINLEKTPGSAGRAVLIIGGGRPVESVSYDPQKGTAIIKVGGQEIAVSGVSSPQDLLVATSALDASQGILADIGAVAAAVADRGGSASGTSPSPSDRPGAGVTPSSPNTAGVIAEKDRQIALLKAQMEQMKQQMEQMQKQLAAMQGQGAPPPTGGSEGPSSPPSNAAPPSNPGAGSSTPESTPQPQGSAPPSNPSADAAPPQGGSATNPTVQPSVDFRARASLMYQELSRWTGGTWITPGMALGLSSQLKVMHQIADLSPQQAAELRRIYESGHPGSNLVEDIDAKLSAGRAAALKAKLSAFNPVELATLMRDNIDAWVKDSPDFLVEVITNLPFEQRQAVANEFQKLTGQSILAKLQEDWAIYDRTTLIAPFLSGEDIPGLQEAAELYQLMDGVGYNDQPLILEVLQRGQATPAEIARVFDTFYAKGWDKSSLLEVLADEVDEQTVAAATSLIQPQPVQ